MHRAALAAVSVACDVAVVGAGHNGLVAATLLASAGLTVRVFEAKRTVGGACKTETPFERAPALKHSTGAYLLGPFPPELLAALGVTLPIIKRDPHYFLPTPAAARGGAAIFGADAAASRSSFLSMFTEADWAAHTALQAEVAAIASDFAPAMLAPPLAPEATAERYVRPALRRSFVDLVTGSISSYLARFDFRSDLVRAMYAATDALSGVTAGPDDRGTGFNFLMHNAVRTPGTGGAWALVRGGMGTVTSALADAARKAGATIETERAVATVDTARGAATGVTLADGSHVAARAVVVNADPLTLSRITDLPPAAAAAVKSVVDASTPATTAKLNLCLSSLPSFPCAPTDIGQHRTTTHLLCGAESPRATTGAMAALTDAARAAAEGRVVCEPGAHPPIEFYFASVADPSVRDAQGRHSAALFVQLAPALADEKWTPAFRELYTRSLLNIVAHWAPDIHACVHEALLLAPPDIESHFGIGTRHIHHITNSLALTDRFPTAVPGIDALYSSSAGTHPGGSVAGCAGYLAARAAGEALGVKVKEVTVGEQ